MYAVIERDRDGHEKVIRMCSDFVTAYDFAQSLEDDMEDNGCNYLVREVKENG